MSVRSPRKFECSDIPERKSYGYSHMTFGKVPSSKDTVKCS
jgi:hypothetical protein